MSENTESLNDWFLRQSKWLQIAASRLYQGTELTDEVITELADLCRKEANGEAVNTTSPFPAFTFQQEDRGNLRLFSISDVEGVNALAPRKPLEFGEGNLTIVYGNNGSGKSGYVRLLKHVCGARKKGDLLSNVFKSGPTAQKARIMYEQNGCKKEYEWTVQRSCDALNSVDIFDTSFGEVFVSKEDEVSYEPPELLFFSSLIRVCEKVAFALENQSNQLQSKKPNIPAEKGETLEGIWYKNISAKTSTQDIDEHCAFGSADETKMQTLQRRLNEPAPAERAKQLIKQKTHIDTLVQDAQKYLKQLSDENCRLIIAAKEKSILKKTAAATAAKKIFSNNDLEGIGSDVWKELWEAARKYSVSAAYKEAEYPNVSDGSRCVLCHQPLTQEAKNRLISFESFLKGELQKASLDADKEYESACKTIEELPTLDSLKMHIDAADISQDEFANQVTDFYDELRNRKNQLFDFGIEEAIIDPLLPPKWIEEANAYSKRFDVLASKFDEDAKKDNRKEVANEIKSMETRKWLSEQRTAINEEVNRLKRLSQIQEARKLTNTQSLSKKKGERAEILITDEFVKGFNRELKALCASHVKVDPVLSKVSKGRALHKLQLRNASQNGSPMS